MMKDANKTREQLTTELAELRQRIAELEVAETERKQAEEALRESEGRFREVFEHSRDALYKRNLETGRYEYISPAIAKITGYTPDEVVAMSPDEIDSLIHPEDIEWINDLRRNVLETPQDHETVSPVEYRVKRKDGSYRWISDHYALLRDPEGRPLFSVASVRDITERKRAEEERERRSQELTMLNEIGRAVTSSLEFDKVLALLLDWARQGLGAEACSVALLDDNGDVVFHHAEGEGAEAVIGLRLKPGQGIAGHVAQSGQSALVPDAHADPCFYGEVAPGFTTRDMVCVPLVVRDQIIGVIELLNKHQGMFAEDDVQVLESVASQAATAIENARLFGEARQRVAELEALRRTSLQLTSSLDLSAVLDSIAESALTLVGATDCHIYLYDEANETFTFGAALWEDGRREAAVKAPRRDGFTATVAREGGPMVINDAAHHPLYATPEAQKWNLQAIAGFPLKRAGRVLGVFNIVFLEPHTFSEEELRVLGLLADQAAIAIENARLFELTRRQSERLAQTLAVSESLHRGLELEQVLEQIAQGAVGLGFRRAVINVYQPEEDLVRVRAVAGLEGPEREKLMSATYHWSDFQTLMQERFQVSRSYLIRQGEMDWERDFQGVVVVPSIVDRGLGYWRPEDMLLVPLWGTHGERVGLLSMDDPVDGLLPNLNTIWTLEAFANQAAIAIENARLFGDVEQAKAEWEATFDAIGDGISIHDRDFRLVRANRALAQRLGIAPEALVGHICYELFHHTTTPPTWCPRLKATKTGQPQTVEIEEPVLDGTFLISAYPLFDEQGQVSGSVHVFKDITERRQLEAQLRQAQKMESIGQLAGGVAHDFNNLLTPIGGFSELLLGKAPEGSQQQEYLRQIKVAAERAAALTGQLLLFTRQARGERRSVQLNSVVEETRDLLERSIPKEITIELRLASGLWAVEADLSQISQVLMNLCVNARDAMPDGGTLTLETRNVTLDEEYAQAILEAWPGRYVCLSVSDTGGGMSPEVQARLFEPFFTTKEIGKGTGLGLAVVYGIVKGHDGFINVYSQEGRGSTFHVYLPAIELAVEEGEIEGLELPTGMETILLVDDEEMVLALGQAVLEPCGYTVLMAEDGLQALEVYQAHRGEIALVVLDVIMPQMGGLECLRRLREMDPRVRVLISTGYTVKGLAQELVAEGALGVVEKPFRIQDFATAVRMALDQP